ncbi:MFS transporter [Leifsonia shinshuensis]|uniref:DHA2 family methylenomycin A resistance protein-like MFS transporter n=1 Tax=Leifsonia shinshuensis TaxID=150026 RepID=A0A853CVD2_9MICO|nr:MFS transporter [Leifsonia shinshuensis]NYJ24617.1 DHA2 family methylenomycin A resistance protein-like MFS transporter [Leifsonia shinshuensis]
MKQSTAILWAACLGYGMVILDTSVLNVALPSIALETNASGAQQRWMIDAYVLVMTALLLAGGGLIDRFGAKRIFHIGVAIFAVASMACAIVSDANLLIVGRTLQGIGGALLIPATLTVVVTHFTDQAQRGKAIALIATVTASPQAFGPTLGGLLVDTLGWRSIFLLNVPIAVVTLFLGRRIAAGVASTRKLDIPGLLSFALALGALTFGVIDLSENRHLTAASITACVVAVGAGAIFLFIERSVSSPLLPRSVLHAKNLNLVVLAGTFMFILFYGALFAANLYFQKVLQMDALSAGLWLLPAGVPVFALPILVAKLAKRRSAFVPTMIGIVVATIGASAALLSGVFEGPIIVAASLLIIGIGFGIASPPHLNLATGAAPAGAAGVVSALANAGRQAGYLLGVAAVGTAGLGLDGYLQASWVAITGGVLAITALGLSRMRAVLPRRSESPESEPATT